MFLSLWQSPTKSHTAQLKKGQEMATEKLWSLIQIKNHNMAATWDWALTCHAEKCFAHQFTPWLCGRKIQYRWDYITQQWFCVATTRSVFLRPHLPPNIWISATFWSWNRVFFNHQIFIHQSWWDKEKRINWTSFAKKKFSRANSFVTGMIFDGTVEERGENIA